MAIDHFSGKVMQRMLTQLRSTFARAVLARLVHRHSGGARADSDFGTPGEGSANRRFTSKRAPGREWQARSFTPWHGGRIGIPPDL